MIEIQTGYCVCCGSPQIVQVSGSQRDADMMATAKCGCDGAIQARMMARVHQAVDEVTSSGAELDGYGEVHHDVVRLMEDVAQRMLPRIRETTERQRAAQAAVEAAQAATEDAQRSREQLEGVKQSLMENAKAQAGSDPTQGIYG